MFEKKIVVNTDQQQVIDGVEKIFAGHTSWECIVQDKNHLRIQTKTEWLSQNNDPFQLDIYLKESGVGTTLTISDSGSSFVLIFQIVAYMGTWIAAPTIALSTEGISILPKLLLIVPLVTLTIWLAGKLFRMRTKSVVRMITETLKKEV